MACLRCGGEHQMEDCKSKSSACINCRVMSDKRKVNLHINHTAWSRDCPVLISKKERAKTSCQLCRL